MLKAFHLNLLKYEYCHFDSLAMFPESSRHQREILITEFGGWLCNFGFS